MRHGKLHDLLSVICWQGKEIVMVFFCGSAWGLFLRWICLWFPNGKSISLFPILWGQKSLINLYMNLFRGFMRSGAFGRHILFVQSLNC